MAVLIDEVPLSEGCDRPVPERHRHDASEPLPNRQMSVRRGATVPHEKESFLSPTLR
jgi:hypothetical protein